MRNHAARLSDKKTEQTTGTCDHTCRTASSGKQNTVVQASKQWSEQPRNVDHLQPLMPLSYMGNFRRNASHVSQSSGGATCVLKNSSATYDSFKTSSLCRPNMQASKLAKWIRFGFERPSSSVQLLSYMDNFTTNCIIDLEVESVPHSSPLDEEGRRVPIMSIASFSSCSLLYIYICVYTHIICFPSSGFALSPFLITALPLHIHIIASDSHVGNGSRMH